MILEKIEEELRSLADYIRDNPDQQPKIMTKSQALFKEIFNSADLKVPSLLAKKAMLEEQRKIIADRMTHFDEGVKLFGDTEADVSMIEGIAILKNQHQGALDGLDMELGKINVQLGIK